MTVDNKTRLQFKMQKRQYAAFLLTPEMPNTRLNIGNLVAEEETLVIVIKFKFSIFLAVSKLLL